MAIQIIGAGLGRTGTLSLKFALEQLGFKKCYHMIELFQNPQGLPYWEAAGRGEKVEWSELFEGYLATVDYPGGQYYRELMAYYPDAKVILTLRDPQAWYESVRSTIYRAGPPKPGDPPPPPQLIPIFQMIQRNIWGKQFQGRFEDRDFAISVFNNHNDEVKRTVPRDRLLVYEVKQGWQPLCQFLGVPVPEGQPFPHVNSREDFGKVTLKQVMEMTAAPSQPA